MRDQYGVEQVAIQCEILLEVVKEKVELLEQIFNLTLNQHTVLEMDSYQESIFENLAKEKDKRIQRINELDDFFERTYTQIKENIMRESSDLKEIIQFIQQEIRKIGEWTIQIQLYEEKNRQSLQSNFANITKTLRNTSIGKTQALRSYKEHTRFTKKNI